MKLIENESAIENIAEKIDSMEDLYAALKGQDTFEVCVHIGRNSLECPLGHKLFNMKSFKKEEAEVLLSDVSGVVANIVPVTYKKELRSIENSVRQKLNSLCLGNTDFITDDNFTKFIEYFEEKKTEYFKLRDEICENYELIVSDFLRRQKALMDGLNPDYSEMLLKEIKSSIPKVQTVRSSFYMNYEIKTSMDLAIFPIDIQQSIKENMVENTRGKIKDIVGGEMQKAYKKIIKCVEKEKIAPKSISALTKLGRDMVEHNILNNKMLEIVGSKIIKASKHSDETMLISECEEAICLIYGYCHENNMTSYFNGIESPISTAQMVEVYELLMEDIESES